MNRMYGKILYLQLTITCQTVQLTGVKLQTSVLSLCVPLYQTWLRPAYRRTWNGHCQGSLQVQPR